MANINAIKLPDGNKYNLVDETSGYITSSDLPTPLIGTTANTTPTQVKAALDAGRDIIITHTDSLFLGTIKAYSFNYSDTAQVINAISIINTSIGYYIVQLTGDLSNNTWDARAISYPITTLNGYDDYTPSFYAPTTSGTSGQYLQSNGANQSPSWVNLPIIPTKTSDLTNDSGFVTTDENLKTTALDVGNSMYLIGGSSSESTGTKLTDGALQYTRYLNGRCWLSIGKASTEGILRLFNAKSGGVYTTLRPNADITTSNTIYLPGSDGTLALTSDIPPTPLIPTDLSDLNNDLNVSDFPNDAGYITGYTETDPIFTASAAHGISASDITNWNSKQAALVSGTNIKTINSQSLLGSGNIQISGSGTSTPTADTVAEFDSSAHMKSTDMTAAEITSFVNSLNVTGIHAVDYIIEEGTSDNSSYRKWNSGIAECWVRTQQNVAINLSYGSLYQGTWTWTFPITFIENPTVTCSRFKWGSGASWGTVSTETTTGASLRGIDTSSRASGSTIISAYAIGKWK